MFRAACGGLLAVLTAADMAVKQYIEDTYGKGEEYETVLPKVRLRKVYNTGFAFNLFDRYPKLIRQCSAVSALGVLAGSASAFLKKGRRGLKLGMTFVMAGAASNLYDRLARGKVIDYIGVESENSYLSKLTANLADFYIVIGMAMVTVSQMIHRKKDRS